MLSEGSAAPRFELPALVDGEKRRVALSEYLGDDVVILAFYPADFNPACDAESCDLDQLDLFTMQKDVSILGISPDSVYSHRAFADRYDLNVPLLADTGGEVADQYDIGLVDDIGQRLLERAVAIVDHDGTITYSWSTDDMSELPRVGEITDALASAGSDDTAFARYRVGHAHYTEGRRSFTSAMENFREAEWMLAQHDFQQAREEFEEAADQFDTAVRFVDDESLVPIYEGANEKATALWQAADWLVESASAYSSGSGARGQELRDDAEIPLNTVREYAEPPDPDEAWPPDMENLEMPESEDRSILPTEADVTDAALKVDIDAEVADADDAGGATDTGGDDGAAADTVETDDEASTAVADGAADDDIDDAELAEIQAELAANNPDSEPSVEEVTEESTAIVEAPPMSGDTDADDDPDNEVPPEPTTMVEAPPMDGDDADAADTGPDEESPAETGRTADAAPADPDAADDGDEAGADDAGSAAAAADSVAADEPADVPGDEASDTSHESGDGTPVDDVDDPETGGDDEVPAAEDGQPDLELELADPAPLDGESDEVPGAPPAPADAGADGSDGDTSADAGTDSSDGDTSADAGTVDLRDPQEESTADE